MFQLVRYSCDCIGTAPINGVTTMVRSCDGEGNLSFYQRKIENKSFRPLSSEETEEFRSELEKLILDGYNMKAMRSVLGVQTQLKKLLE